MSASRVVVVGVGAAGIAAGLRLARAPVELTLLEARDRIGGRAHTVTREGLPLDLGCGWLHDAEANPWRAWFVAHGVTIDETPPPWSGPALTANFPAADQRAFHAAFDTLERRLAEAAEAPEDRPASDLMEPGGRWNGLLNAFSAAYNGEAFERISVKDYAAYEEGEQNHRVPSGYGSAIAGAAAGLPVRLSSPVTRIDHHGRAVRVETQGGALEADAVIVTLPSAMLAAETLAFDPPLPQKAQAARGVPLGLADKVFLHLDQAEDFPAEGLLYGATDTVRTASHHLRPFGRPVIESYFGGDTARELEGDAAADFAIGQIVSALGSHMRARLRPLASTCWERDPWSHGAYSHALPGHAGDRAVLAAPVDGRLFFAGEATSATWFSTAHGAYATGVRAAEEALAALALS